MYYTSRDVYEYISKHTNDPIIEWKTCRVSGQQFPVYQSDLEFYAKVSPTFAGQTFSIPTPTLCPEERQRRRLLFRNERKLYRRTCDATNKPIISIYSPDKPYKVYDQKVRWSDQRDPLSYERVFDFSKTFTEQIGDLMLSVPRPCLINEIATLENSEYVNNSMTCKNCYLLAGGTNSEGCMYCTTVYGDKDCVDCYKIYHSNNCYNCLYCYSCTQCVGCLKSTSCSQSAYLVNCTNCTHCFQCSSLVNKEYYINNIPHTKESYIETIHTLYQTGSIVFHDDYPALYTKQSEASIGILLENTRQCVLGYDIANCENVKYIIGTMNCSDSMDVSLRGDGLTHGYEVKEVGIGAYNVLFSFTCRDGISDTYYSQLCQTGKHLFGCIGLRHKQYCIFNKQYTRDEYEKTVAKIIAHMQETGERGEFFHPSLGPFGYNETVAQEHYPISQEEASQRGYARQHVTYDPKIPENADVVKPQQYTDDAWELLKMDEQITKKVFICVVSGRPFLLQKAEVEFYRKHNVPLPKKHPDVRHEERVKLRPPIELHLRMCDQCGKEMVSVYQTGGTDKMGKGENEQQVYCEACYTKKVYA